MEQSYRLGYLAALVESRSNFVHVALADEVTRNCDCMGNTRRREVLWRGFEVFQGESSKKVDEAIWEQLGGVLGAVHQPTLFSAQLAGYEDGRERVTADGG